MYLKSYNSKDDWCSTTHSQLPITSVNVGQNLPIMSPNPYILSRFASNIPMPTLYAGDAVRKPKLSVIEVLLYNMAALLAGVAAGYDVRMSNISPFHPILLNEVPALKAPLDMEFPNVLPHEQRCFATNTYHGPIKHHRATINSATYKSNEESTLPCRDSPCRTSIKEFKPITNDQPKEYYEMVGGIKKLPSNTSTMTTSGLGGSNFTNNTSGLLSSSLGSQTQPPTPSPRRKISTSSFTESLEYSQSDFNRFGLKDFRLGSSGNNIWGVSEMPAHPKSFMPRDDVLPPFYGAANNMRNGQSFSNDGGTYGVENQSTGYFGSNYFPYKPEYQLPYERDCKSYPDYSYNCKLLNYNDYTCDVPLPPASANVVRTPPPRVPQMGVTAAGHRRIPSAVSNNFNYNETWAPDYDDPSTLYEYRGKCKGDSNIYRENVLPDCSAPSLTNQREPYNNSPQLKNKRYVGQQQWSSEWSRNRDYENLTCSVSPLHKPLYQSPQRARVMEESVLSTVTNFQLASIGQTILIDSTPRRIIYNRSRSTPMSPISVRNCPSPPSPAPLDPIKIPTPTILPERPDSLPFDTAQLSFTSGNAGVGTKLRSSMKKYNNYKTPNGAPANMIGGVNTANSSPTNPTPPDSLTSDDSSYVSAKEGSLSSHSRVRFSPEAFLDASPGTVAISSISHQNNSSNNTATATYASQRLALYQNRAIRRHRHNTASNKSSPSPSSS